MTYDQWFKENKDKLEKLLQNDQEQLIWECWLAGYEAGTAEMSSFASDLFKDII